MKAKRHEEKKYRTVEEFEREFFPAAGRVEWRKADDPRVFGANLAKESVDRISSLICSKRSN